MEAETSQTTFRTASDQEECPICYDSFIDRGHDEETGHSPYLKEKLCVEGCRHEFCRDCLTNHCKHAVSVRAIPIPCPANASEKCNNLLQESQVAELLCVKKPAIYGSITDEVSEKNDSVDWIRFQRYQRMLQDPSLLSCSRCLELFSKEENQSFDVSENQLSCPYCGHSFCSVHGDSHPGKTCQEYKPARQILQSEMAIKQFTKPCSRCGVPIEKESGCDHIICPSCNGDMCFKCGTHSYLSGEIIRTCKNCEQNYIDHRHVWAYRLTLCLSLPLYIPICLTHILFTGAVAIATCGCFCCLGCGIQMDKGETSFKPVKAIRTVLAMVLLPAIDLARQCGVPCCCGLEIPESSADPATELDHDGSEDDSDESNDV